MGAETPMGELPERVDVASPLDDPAARREEVERRLEALRRLVAPRGRSGCLLRMRRNFAWLTAGGQNHVVLASETGVAPVLVTSDRATVFAPVNEAPRIADEELRGLPFDVAAVPWHDSEAAVQEARRRAGPDLLDDEALEEALVPVRSRLSALDHHRMRWLGRFVREALASAVESIGPGASEDDVAAALGRTAASAGVRSPVVLVAADERIERYRHPIPVGAPIRRRVMAVLVGERWGLHVALTRIRELEAPAGDLARRTQAVETVLARMAEATRPGATLGDVLETARRAYADAGFADEWQLHHQGGTIGYQGRETIAVPGSRVTVEGGMAFAWNPSITGAKVEETFIVHPDGSRETVAS